MVLCCFRGVLAGTLCWLGVVCPVQTPNGLPHPSETPPASVGIAFQWWGTFIHKTRGGPLHPSSPVGVRRSGRGRRRSEYVSPGVVNCEEHLQGAQIDGENSLCRPHRPRTAPDTAAQPPLVPRRGAPQRARQAAQRICFAWGVQLRGAPARGPDRWGKFTVQAPPTPDGPRHRCAAPPRPPSGCAAASATGGAANMFRLGCSIARGSCKGPR